MGILSRCVQVVFATRCDWFKIGAECFGREVEAFHLSLVGFLLLPCGHEHEQFVVLRYSVLKVNGVVGRVNQICRIRVEPIGVSIAI